MSPLSFLRDLRVGAKVNSAISIIFFALLLALVLVVRLSISNFTVQTGLGRVVRESQTTQARLAEIEHLILTDVELVAADPALIIATANGDVSAARTALLVGAAPFGFDHLELVDARGSSLVSLGEVEHRGDAVRQDDPLKLALLGIPATGGVTEEKGEGESGLHLAAVAPLRDESGVIVGGLLASREIDDEFLNELTEGQAIDIMLVHRGQIAAKFHDEYVEGEEEKFSDSALLDEALVSQALAGETVTMENMLLSEENQPHAVAYTPLTVGGETEAALIILTDLGGLYTLQRDLTTNASILFGVLALVTIATVAWLNQRIVAVPLGQLQGVAEQLAGGNYQQRAEATSQDEVGLLAAAFNQMAGAIQKRETELKDLAASLEKRVEERTAELAMATRQALEANRLKSEFLATMSHELRTPLNAIIGLSDMFVSGMVGDVSDRQMQYLERIAANGRRQLNLVGDLLDMSKIEAGRLEVVEDPFTVIALAEHLETEWQPRVAEKGLVFNVAVDPQIPTTLLGDISRLQQIVDNLVGNALKFTDAGKIEIAFDRLNNAVWTIIVADTGRGIPPESQEIIFDEFRQVDASSTREHGGAGLGLAIVRKLAMLMGGQVNVRSRVGQGSTFTVKLPIKVPEAELA